MLERFSPWLVPILVLGLMILVHEFGHFFVARRVGMRVYEFAIFFGHPILRWVRGGIVYSLRWIPFGGFVRIAGLEFEEGEGADDPNSFRNKPLSARAAVIIAGPLMNIVLAVLIYFVIGFTWGRMVTSNVIGRVQPGSPADKAKLQPGDHLVGVKGMSVRVTGVKVVKKGSREHRQGFKVGDCLLTLRGSGATGADPIQRPVFPASHRRLLWTVRRSGMSLPLKIRNPSDLKPGDVILAVEKIGPKDLLVLSAAIFLHPASSIRLQVQRGKSLQELIVFPREEKYFDEETNTIRTRGLIGIEYARHRLSPVSFSERLQAGWQEAWYRPLEQIQNILFILARPWLFKEAVGGPLLIISEIKERTWLGVRGVLEVTADISFAVAIFNLLPIPILDGGFFLFFLWEILFRRPVPRRLELNARLAGLALLLTLVLLITYQDLFRMVDRWVR